MGRGFCLGKDDVGPMAPHLCLVKKAQGDILSTYMYTDHTNIKTIFNAELEQDIWEGC